MIRSETTPSADHACLPSHPSAGATRSQWAKRTSIRSACQGSALAASPVWTPAAACCLARPTRPLAQVCATRTPSSRPLSPVAPSASPAAPSRRVRGSTRSALRLCRAHSDPPQAPASASPTTTWSRRPACTGSTRARYVSNTTAPLPPHTPETAVCVLISRASKTSKVNLTSSGGPRHQRCATRCTLLSPHLLPLTFTSAPAVSPPHCAGDLLHRAPRHSFGPLLPCRGQDRGCLMCAPSPSSAALHLAHTQRVL
mmetsp:Transcript_4825/g.8287  ORF Transcript_4825/g.8287 Transcript_4825/m.8287 type:complete len:256 (+) Transcript_4825:644-1411(+)